MSNLMKVPTGSMAAVEQFETALGALAGGISSGGGDPYLRMGKDGIWVYGPESIEVEKGSLWAVHPFTIEHGFVCWANTDGGQAAQKLGEVMVPSTTPVPNVASLPQHGAPWVQQVGFGLVCVSGEDTGAQVRYYATSKSGLAAIKRDLLDPMRGQVAAEKAKGPISENSLIVPVVILANDHYTHKAYGKIYTPVFQFEYWGSLANQSRPNGGGTVTNARARTPQGGAPAAAQVEADPVAAEPQPQPRRRTRGRA